MIDLSEKALLMIEPTNPVVVQIDDVLTSLAEKLFRKAKSNDIRYRGVHVCVCGERSDNNDWILPTGHVTNSLMVHYVRCHRNEILESEIEKLETIATALDIRS